MPGIHFVRAALMLFGGLFCFAQPSPSPIGSQADISWMYTKDKTTHQRNISKEQSTSLKASLPGDFLWFMENGKAFLVKDPEALATLQKLIDEGKPLWTTKPKLSTPTPTKVELEDLKAHHKLLHNQSDNFNKAVIDLSRKAIQQGLVVPVPIDTPSK